MNIKNILFLLIFFIITYPGSSDNIYEGITTIIRNPIPREMDNLQEDYFSHIMIFNLNINLDDKSTNILLKTREGCSETGFNFKRDFILNYIYRYRSSNFVIIASTIDDLIYLQNEYFDLPFFDTFSNDYFEEYYLVLVLTTYTGNSDLRNERFEQNDEKHAFSVEYWHRGIREGEGILLCAFNALYVLEISKN